MAERERGPAEKVGGAVRGWPSRAGDLDVWPGFVSPPAGYGEVGFYWWVGDVLDRERIRWQLDLLAGRSITALQVNYAHSDKGGISWGLTYDSEPGLFTQQWWELFGWFMGEAKARGMSVSLSDYTLGVGQGYAWDAALRERPWIAAVVLAHCGRAVSPGEKVRWPLPAKLLSVAWVSDGRLTDLTARVVDGVLEWEVGRGAKGGVLHAVWTEERWPSINPTHPESGRAVIEHFFGAFERRFPGEAGKGLDYFFSDELEFLLKGGKVWSTQLEAEFERTKGYALRPLVAGLFADVGAITPKVRLDFNDVFVGMSETNYFKPIYDWHQSRGMTYGCDHGGRGRNVAEFGDYFRTQRWNQGPGCDQPMLGCDLIKNKVAASIAHLYERPRVWLEGFYSSGWGTSSGQVWDAVCRNFLQGHNLLTLHGLYYTTHGGWWEWAPPCNHFRQPYWTHMPHLLRATERLSYLLSQGVHVCDVAVMYPVADAVGGDAGAVKTAFATAEGVYAAGRDFDFMDDESLLRAEVRGGRLEVAGESFGVLVMPGARVLRHAVLEKSAAFARAGGVVVAIEPLPETTDRTGRDDPEVAALVAELRRTAVVVADVASAVREVTRHARAEVGGDGVTHFLHRRAGPRDVFAFTGAGAGNVVTLRATGVPQRWDPWTGHAGPVEVVSRQGDSTTVRVGGGDALQVVVFSPDGADAAVEAQGPARELLLDGPWECELVPTLDNRWGDYAWPPSARTLGPEVWDTEYRATEADAWTTVRAGHGPMFMISPASREPLGEAEEAALAASKVPPAVEAAGGWTEYRASWERGVVDDAGHQGYHGLKEEIGPDFIRLGVLVDAHPSTRRAAHPNGDVRYLWTTVHTPRATQARLVIGGDLTPAAMWLGGRRAEAGLVRLEAGWTSLLLRYDRPGAGHVVVSAGEQMVEAKATVGTLRSCWAELPGRLEFDVRPGVQDGRYRVAVPPGARTMTVPGVGEVRAWAGGAELSATRAAGESSFELPAGCDAAELHVSHGPGRSGGAALTGPVRFECGPGRISPGDWAGVPGLGFYSGGMTYRRTLPTLGNDTRRVALDLGDVVSSAEVRVNGRPAGVRLAPPWTFDLTPHLTPEGGDRVEVTVYSSLVGHYRSVPTRYLGSERRSGLLGPVLLRTWGAAGGCANP